MKGPKIGQFSSNLSRASGEPGAGAAGPAPSHRGPPGRGLVAGASGRGGGAKGELRPLFRIVRVRRRFCRENQTRISGTDSSSARIRLVDGASKRSSFAGAGAEACSTRIMRGSSREAPFQASASATSRAR